MAHPTYRQSMHPEVNSDPGPGYAEANSAVHLNSVTFNLAMFAIGVADSDAARGRAIGIAAKWVRSALDGNTVGGKFIGNTITFFRQHRAKLERVGLGVDMDTFFTVPETASAGASHGN